jgi:hypothetical protein
MKGSSEELEENLNQNQICPNFQALVILVMTAIVRPEILVVRFGFMQ